MKMNNSINTVALVLFTLTLKSVWFVPHSAFSMFQNFVLTVHNCIVEFVERSWMFWQVGINNKLINCSSNLKHFQIHFTIYMWEEVNFQECYAEQNSLI